MDEKMYLFVARELEAGPMDLQGGEQIEPRLFEWDEVMQMIRDGGIQDAKTLVGLLYFNTFFKS